MTKPKPTDNDPLAPGAGGKVSCDTHGEGRPGYIVCVHVLAGTRVAHWLDPDLTQKEPWECLGEALCQACLDQPLNLDGLKLICEDCLYAVTLVTRVSQRPQ